MTWQQLLANAQSDNPAHRYRAVVKASVLFEQALCRQYADTVDDPIAWITDPKMSVFKSFVDVGHTTLAGGWSETAKNALSWVIDFRAHVVHNAYEPTQQEARQAVEIYHCLCSYFDNPKFIVPSESWDIERQQNTQHTSAPVKLNWRHLRQQASSEDAAERFQAVMVIYANRDIHLSMRSLRNRIVHTLDDPTKDVALRVVKVGISLDEKNLRGNQDAEAMKDTLAEHLPELIRHRAEIDEWDIPNHWFESLKKPPAVSDPSKSVILITRLPDKDGVSGYHRTMQAYFRWAHLPKPGIWSFSATGPPAFSLISDFDLKNLQPHHKTPWIPGLQWAIVDTCANPGGILKQDIGPNAAGLEIIMMMAQHPWRASSGEYSFQMSGLPYRVDTGIDFCSIIYPDIPRWQLAQWPFVENHHINKTHMTAPVVHLL